jgi:hypothetical protein
MNAKPRIGFVAAIALLLLGVGHADAVTAASVINACVNKYTGQIAIPAMRINGPQCSWDETPMSLQPATDSPVETIAVDGTVNLYRDGLTATTTEFANHRISIDTAAYKTIRVSARRGSCTGCGPVAIRVASGYFGSTMELVTFPASGPGIPYYEGSFSRSFDVPGTSIFIEVRNTVAGQSNDVSIEVAGRAN